MSVGLEGPPPYYADPGDDAEAMTLSDHLRGALGLIAQDRALTPDEMREIQLFMAGVQEIAQMKAQQYASPVQPGQGMFQPGTEEPDQSGGEASDVADAGAEYQ